jgi:hypothetical protein
LGKKIKAGERPAEFARIRDIVFANSKISYDPSNLIQYESYRKALNRFGLVDDFLMIKYPETILKYDLSKEDDITNLMGEVASEYSDVIQRNERDPAGLRADLWQLFRPDYNPKFEGFAEEQLEPIEMTLNQLDKIIKTEDDEEEESRGKAKGTSLEGTFGNPVDLAMTLRRIIDLRYIKSFGYSLEANDDDLSKQDILAYVQMNLTNDAPFKGSGESSKNEESSTKTDSSPLNTTSATKPEEKGATSINTAGETTGPVGASTSAINEPTTKASIETKTSESAADGSLTSTGAELSKETSTPPATTTVNVNLEKDKPSAPTSETPPATILNTQTTIEKPKETASSSEKVESSTNTILKTDSTKSTAINETKEKSGKFSSFLEKASESKIGKAINLGGIVSDLKDQAKDFGAVTKSELGLGKGGPLSKLGTGALNLVDRLKESKKEKSTASSDKTTASTSNASINTTTAEKTSTDTEKILSEKPGVSTSTSTSETIEKNKMIVKPEPVVPIVPPAQVTQNVETSNASQTNQTSAPTTETSQTTNVENQGSSQTTNAGASPGISMPNFAEMERLLSNIQKILVLGIDELKTEKYD